MADQNVHFEDISGGDTGERADAAAILPYAAGEKVKAAILDRPLENLRGRTEILRSEIEDLKYLVDSNIRWIISSGANTGAASGHSQPKVVSRPSPVLGTFTLSEAAIVLQPINTPKEDNKTSATYTFGGGTSTLTFSTSLFGYEQPKGGGANPFPRGTWQRVKWSNAAASTLGANHCTVVLEGNPVHILHITVATEETTTVAELHAQLDLTTSMATFGFTEVVATGTETDIISWADITNVSDDAMFLNTVDREMHYLTKVQIDAYFTAYGALADGDTLSIGFPFLVDPETPVTKGGRRQATPTSLSGSPNTEVSSSQLFVSSTAPYLTPLSIPICKRVGSDLIFIDGTIFRGDETNGVYFGSSGYTNYYLSTTTTGSSGATAVGVSTHAHVAGHKSADVFDITAGTLQSVLEAAQLFINDKASLDSNELVEGQWLWNDTQFAYEPDVTDSIVLYWRTGRTATARPGDSQVGWQTISKYGIYLNSELFYVTIQGAYLEYTTAYKLHTPSGSTGNVMVTIESAGAMLGNEAKFNIRGTRRLYNPAANTTFDLFPADWFSDSLSGDISSNDGRTIWGTSLWLSTPALYVSADVLAIRSNTESTTVGSAMATHTAPTLVATTNVLGAMNKSYFNRVLEGFATLPAPLTQVTTGVWSSGCFGIDTITYMGGRAIVAGNVITIPEMRTLTGVVNNHMLPGTTLPASSLGTQWYGLWLRSDGVMRVGPLPVHSLSVGIPGASMYFLPIGNTDSGFYPYDYTLVNLVWSYQGNTAGAIRFAGITHTGGNVWVYQQARLGDFLSPVTWSTYVDHKFLEVNYGTSDAFTAEETIAGYSTCFNATTLNGYGLPGIPTSISCTGILNARVSVHLNNPGSQVSLYLLHNLYPLDAAYNSWSPFAPPTISAPAARVANLSYDVVLDSHYGAAVWSDTSLVVDTAAIARQIDATILYPFTHASDVIPVPTTAGIVNAGYLLTLNNPSALDTAYFRLRTLGFMWDRYNAGGIMV
jgi:hypothetical protein